MLRHQMKESDAPIQHKVGHIYVDGRITSTSRGLYHIQLEDGLVALCTARKLEHKRIKLLIGDRVCAEIPVSSISPDRIRGRLVWRFKN
jgi:translation initiation factor IF-1